MPGTRAPSLSTCFARSALRKVRAVYAAHGEPWCDGCRVGGPSRSYFYIYCYYCCCCYYYYYDYYHYY